VVAINMPVARWIIVQFHLQAIQPLFTTILRWIYEGELDDTYHEVNEQCLQSCLLKMHCFR